MKIDTRQDRGVTILDLKGKLTIGAGEVLLRDAVQQVVNAGQTKVLINLAGVTIVDSSGVGELVSAYTAVSNRGGRLKLVNLPAKLNELLHVTQLVTVFELYDNETEAIDSFQ